MKMYKFVKPVAIVTDDTQIEDLFKDIFKYIDKHRRNINLLIIGQFICCNLVKVNSIARVVEFLSSTIEKIETKDKLHYSCYDSYTFKEMKVTVNKLKNSIDSLNVLHDKLENAECERDIVALKTAIYNTYIVMVNLSDYLTSDSFSKYAIVNKSGCTRSNYPLKVYILTSILYHASMTMMLKVKGE